MRIKLVRMNNCQSWADGSPALNLSMDKINVISAENETGKSVMWKMITTMCFPHDYYDINDLIRTDSNAAQIMFLMEDNTILSFCILKDKGFIYYIKYPDNTEKKWAYKLKDPEAEIPEEMENILELILDRKAKIVVNVVEKERQPFINTNPEIDARVFSTVLEDSKMEQTIENMGVFLDKTIQGAKYVLRDIHTNENMLLNYPHVDVMAIDIRVKKKEQVLNIAKEMVLIETDLNLLCDVKKSKPRLIREMPEIAELMSLYSNSFYDLLDDYNRIKVLKPSKITNVEDINKLNNIYNTCEDIYTDLQNLSQFTKTKPKKIRVRVKKITALLNIYTLLQDLSCCLSNTVEVIKTKPDLISNLNYNELNNLSLVFESITSMSNVIEQIHLLDKPKVIDNIEDIDKLSNLLTFIPAYETTNAFNVINHLSRNNEYLYRLQKEFDEYKNKIGVCPTCGQRFEVHDEIGN